MSKSLKIRIFIGVIIFSGVFNVFCLSNTYAKIKSDSALYKLSLLQAFQGGAEGGCYKYAKSEVTNMEFMQNGWRAIFDGYNKDNSAINEEEGVWITTHVGNSLSNSLSPRNDSNLSCKEALDGYNDWGGKAKGLIDYYDMAKLTLEEMGYEKVSTGSSVDGIMELKITFVENKIDSSKVINLSEGSNLIECSLTDADKNGKRKIKGCKGEINIKEGGSDGQEFLMSFSGGLKPTAVKSNGFGQYEAKDATVEGWLRNVEGSGIFWSGDWAPPYVKCNYNGEKCIRYPWGN